MALMDDLEGIARLLERGATDAEVDAYVAAQDRRWLEWAAGERGLGSRYPLGRGHSGASCQGSSRTVQRGDGHRSAAHS